MRGWIGTTIITQKSALQRYLHCIRSCSRLGWGHHFCIPLFPSYSIYLPYFFFLTFYFVLKPTLAICSYGTKDFLCSVGELCCFYLSSLIAGRWNWQWSPVSHAEPWVLRLYVVPFHRKGCTRCSFQEALLCPFLHPNMLFLTVGYTHMIYWDLFVICLWFPYTHWETSESLNEKHLAGS